MTRHRIEQAAVTVAGFFLGAALAMGIAPGDVFMWVVVGIVLGLFCRAFFIRDLGGELFWPMHHTHQPRRKSQDQPAPRHAQ
jgi:hypothetical protein